jgi:rhodanese-related sulfurtransferase
MSKVLPILLLTGLAVVGYYYWNQPPALTVKKPSLVVINVLDKKEYEDCHIAGSIQVDFDQVDEFAQKLDKATTIVVYCSNYMCTTSDYVAKKLRDKGFEKVFVYAGGMAEWHQKGLPVQGACKGAYLAKVVQPPLYYSESHGIITAENLVSLMDNATR